MKYIKACDILPLQLISEIQDYIDGHVIYIPNKSGRRRPWGDSNGAKLELKQRNTSIRIAHKSGYSIKELSDKYSLSVETIKKIVYTR